MKDIISRIISIDKSARASVENSGRDTRKMEESAREEVKRMKAEAINKAKREGQCLYDGKIDAAMARAEEIQRAGTEKIRRVEERYASIKSTMEAEIFDMIIADKAGEGQ